MKAKPFCLLLLSLTPCLAQSANSLKPRDLFLDKDDGSSVTRTASGTAVEGERNRTPRPLAVRYKVVMLSGNRPATAVDPANTVFHDGDGVRLRLTTNQEAFVYILQKSNRTGWNVLFPQAGMPADANRTRRDTAVDFPGESGYLRFNDEAGTEELFVVVTPTREDSLDELLRTKVDQPTKFAPMKRRDLVYQAVDEKDSTDPGFATYVSSRGASQPEPLILKIDMRHE